MLVRQRASVVLPAPVAPITTVSVPAGTSHDRSTSAGAGAPA